MAKATNENKFVSFGGGLSCGLLTVGEKSCYVINPHYMISRAKFTQPKAVLHYYLVEWDPSALSWKDFRGKVVGSADPSSAPVDSLRRKIYDNWKDLGLTSKPSKVDNSIHASASPFEALVERCNWLGVTMCEDTFGRRCIDAHV